VSMDIKETLSREGEDFNVQKELICVCVWARKKTVICWGGVEKGRGEGDDPFTHTL
jgi:hypothetical protein